MNSNEKTIVITDDKTATFDKNANATANTETGYSFVKITIESGYLANTTKILTPSKPFLIGRNNDCDINFDSTKEPTVGRYHIKLELKANGVLLTDLGSRNGTFYQGKKLIDSIFITNATSFQLGEKGPAVRIEIPPAEKNHMIAQDQTLMIDELHNKNTDTNKIDNIPAIVMPPLQNQKNSREYLHTIDLSKAKEHKNKVELSNTEKNIKKEIILKTNGTNQQIKNKLSIVQYLKDSVTSKSNYNTIDDGKKKIVAIALCSSVYLLLSFFLGVLLAQ